LPCRIELRPFGDAVNVRLDRGLRERLELCPIPVAEQRSARLKGKSPIFKLDLPRGPRRDLVAGIGLSGQGPSRLRGWPPCQVSGSPAVPFKMNANRRHHIPRQRHRVTNWAEYDAGLRQRGSLTVWLCVQ